MFIKPPFVFVKLPLKHSSSLVWSSTVKLEVLATSDWWSRSRHKGGLFLFLVILNVRGRSSNVRIVTRALTCNVFSQDRCQEGHFRWWRKRLLASVSRHLHLIWRETNLAPMAQTEEKCATAISANIVIVRFIWNNCDHFCQFLQRWQQNVPITFSLRFLLAVGLKQDICQRNLIQNFEGHRPTSFKLIWSKDGNPH